MEKYKESLYYIRFHTIDFFVQQMQGTKFVFVI